MKDYLRSLLFHATNTLFILENAIKKAIATQSLRRNRHRFCLQFPFQNPKILVIVISRVEQENSTPGENVANNVQSFEQSIRLFPFHGGRRRRG